MILQFVIAVLAVSEIIEIWHHSHLFSKWRAITECWEGFLGQVLHCMFCMTPWISLLIVLLLYLHHILVLSGHGFLGAMLIAPVYALAIARAANVINDLGHGKCRTPRAGYLPPASTEAGGDGEGSNFP